MTMRSEMRMRREIMMRSEMKVKRTRDQKMENM